MSETDLQTDAGQGLNVDWRDWKIWCTLFLVTVHLSLIVLAILTFSALFVERILPYEGKTQVVIGVVTAVLLWLVNLFCISKIVEKIEPDASKYLRFLGSGDGSMLLLGWLWVLLFPCFNAFLISEIWTALSFESSIHHYALVLFLSAYFSIHYVVAILRGGVADRSKPALPS